jgi:hypothetical protein
VVVQVVIEEVVVITVVQEETNFPISQSIIEFSN